jgi:hypothetical protein
LEVILAIAILGGCICVIGELVRLGSRHAEEVRLLTTAQLLCESKLEEIEAGITAPEAVASAQFDNNPEWFYSVTVNSLEQEELMEVRVTVEQVEPTRSMPFTFSLVRWMLDPTLEEMTEEVLEPTETSESTSNTGMAGAEGTSDGTR